MGEVVALVPASAAEAMDMDDDEEDLAEMKARVGAPLFDAMKDSLLEVMAKRKAEGKPSDGEG